MKGPIHSGAVVVSDESFRSGDAGRLVSSNIEFVGMLLHDEHLTLDEISRGALRSYFVDYYLAQMNNGGFSQFVYNSRWDPQIMEFVREGLSAIGASRHLRLFQNASRQVEQLGRQRLEEYFESEYFGDNACRDALNAPNDEFFRLSQQEDLLTLNATWLRQLPHLTVLTVDEMEGEARRRGQALPDRERRIADARAKEPRYMKLIRALCSRAGHELSHVTAGDPTHRYEGVETLAWHFITDKGHHHMVEAGGKAIMFRGSSVTERVCEVDASNQSP